MTPFFTFHFLDSNQAHTGEQLEHLAPKSVSFRQLGLQENIFTWVAARSDAGTLGYWHPDWFRRFLLSWILNIKERPNVRRYKRLLLFTQGLREAATEFKDSASCCQNKMPKNWHIILTVPTGGGVLRFLAAHLEGREACSP